MFITPITTLAQRKCIAQVLHSFLAVVPRLSGGVSPPFKTAQDRQTCSPGESFGESHEMEEGSGECGGERDVPPTRLVVQGRGQHRESGDTVEQDRDSEPEQ